MLAGLAVGSAVAANFHLLTHAAFKALLFLAAGSVIHAVGTNLMPDMGGLRRLMPVTFATMTIGLAALAGVPPFAGFFSKEAILGAAEETALHNGPVASWAGWLVLVVGLVTVAVTAAYVMRLWLMTFFGQPRGGVAIGRLHESPPAMRWPLVVLAVPASLLGLIALKVDGLSRWTEVRVGIQDVSGSSSRPPGAADMAQTELHLGTVTSVLSVVLVLAGAGAVYLAWRRAPAGDPTDDLRLRNAMERAFFVDELYDTLFVRPVRRATRGVGWTDDTVVGGAVTGVGGQTGRLAAAVSRTQGGNVQSYLTGLLAGVLLLVLVVVSLS